MANCVVLTEIPATCERNSGGLFEVYVGLQEDVSAIVENETTWNVTTFTVVDNPVQIDIKRKTSMFTDEIADDFVNGSTVATATVNLMLHRRSATSSASLNILGSGQQYLYAILLDANGIYWYCPYLQLQSIGGGSGKERAEGSNYNAVLVAESDHLMYEISAALVAAALAVVS